MSTWSDLSDLELQARLEQRGLLPLHARRLVSDRDELLVAQEIARLLKER